MTPDLLHELSAAMRDLEDLADALDKHAPAYLRQLIAAGADRQRLRGPRCPAGLPPSLAKVVREVADDALVRAAARRPL